MGEKAGVEEVGKMATQKKGQVSSSMVRGLLASPYLSLVSRLVLGGVFLYAGVSKVFDPGELAASILSYGLYLPEWFIAFSSHALPPLEVLLGLYLLVGLFSRSSAWAANGLMILFMAALVQGSLRGLDIDCGCFGSAAEESSNLWVDAARDLGLLALGLQLAFASPGKLSVDASLLDERPYRVSGESAGGNGMPVLLPASLTTLVILAIGTFAVLSIAGGESARSFTPNDSGLLPVGSEAPGFTAETVEGAVVSLDDNGEEEATMLVFFATWCPHCNNEAPIISELESQYEDLRVVMVGIDGRDDPSKVREFVERYDIKGPAIYQPSLGTTYRVSGYPTIYVLDGDDEVVAAHSGEASREVYEEWIEEALGSGS
jgi:thiol-disulfide isomerase/thioredoxin/uncharacterized membrane protein YphA (DoxX/SURF4 family)